MPQAVDRSGAEVVVRFDVRDPRAERWIAEMSSQLVTNIVADQRAALRTAIEASYAQGNGPRAIARELVGSFNKATGKREGGTIGLTQQQAAYVAAARGELSSADREALQNYLTRARRDRRFDSYVEAALKDGDPIPDDIIERMTNRYQDRLLELRAETISRTETMSAVNASRDEAFRQGLAATGYSAQSVTRTWRSAGDGRVRHTHEAMNGQTVQGLDQPFVSPSGAQLMRPGDTSLGAGAAEIIGCRCDVDTDIDFSEGVT